MEPIPETSEALLELQRTGADDLLEQLHVTARRVRDVAPHCVGLSVSYLSQGLTFTLVATDEEIARLDGVQYVADGPCLRSIERDEVVSTDRSRLMNEKSWHLFSLASAATGIASTLSLPVRSHGAVVGSVNLYGASDDAFVGRETSLAGILGAWAPGAVSNADLSFTSRVEAARAPGQLRDQSMIDRATGIISVAEQIDLDSARERLTQAAARAGVREEELARTMVELRGS